jgi:hypothetical protein
MADKMDRGLDEIIADNVCFSSGLCFTSLADKLSSAAMDLATAEAAMEDAAASARTTPATV